MRKRTFMNQLKINNFTVPTLEEIHLLYKKLTQKLINNQMTITTMESCTSGFIASLITDTEGASKILKGAYITYSNEAKVLNGVDDSIIKTRGVYSTETAQAMVKAVLQKYPSDIGIGVTGTFGNVDLANKDSIAGEVYIAISIDSKLILNNMILPVNISRFESKLCVANKIGKIIEKEIF